MEMHNDITLKIDNGKITGITLFDLLLYYLNYSWIRCLCGTVYLAYR